MGLKTIVQGSALSLVLAVAGIVCAPPTIAQQSNSTSQPNLQSAGQQAITTLLKQVVINPTVLVKSTGKPLPSNGSWSVGKDAPASCPQTTDTCVRILYGVPDAHISCEWVVRLVRDGPDGIILEQNEDASRYLLRKISVEQAAYLITPGKQPKDPTITGTLLVEGSVVVRLFVSKTGAVEKAFVISGPAMLRASAMDMLNGWTFKPFVVGTQAVPFETDVTFKVRTYGP